MLIDHPSPSTDWIIATTEGWYELDHNGLRQKHPRSPYETPVNYGLRMPLEYDLILLHVAPHSRFILTPPADRDSTWSSSLYTLPVRTSFRIPLSSTNLETMALSPTPMALSFEDELHDIRLMLFESPLSFTCASTTMQYDWSLVTETPHILFLLTLAHDELLSIPVQIDELEHVQKLPTIIVAALIPAMQIQVSDVGGDDICARGDIQRKKEKPQANQSVYAAPSLARITLSDPGAADLLVYFAQGGA